MGGSAACTRELHASAQLCCHTCCRRKCTSNPSHLPTTNTPFITTKPHPPHMHGTGDCLDADIALAIPAFANLTGKDASSTPAILEVWCGVVWCRWLARMPSIPATTTAFAPPPLVARLLAGVLGYRRLHSLHQWHYQNGVWGSGWGLSWGCSRTYRCCQQVLQLSAVWESRATGGQRLLPALTSTTAPCAHLHPRCNSWSSQVASECAVGAVGGGSCMLADTAAWRGTFPVPSDPVPPMLSHPSAYYQSFNFAN